MTMDLRAMIDQASRWAEERFAQTGRISAMWHVVKSNGDHIVFPVPRTDKDTGAAIMRALFELHDVVRCLFIDEAWVADGTGKGREENERIMAWVNEHGSLHDYPGRIEVVVFQGEDTEDGLVTAHRRIERPAHRKARLGPLEFLDLTGAQSEGRMVGMLRPKTKVH